MITRRATLHGLAAGAAAMIAGPALAQDDKSPVTLLVGAASSMDFTARLIAEQLREPLGRPVIVLSKLGAGGRVALQELKRSAPDGRTLMFSTSSPFAIYPNIYTKLDYDPVTDFTPIAGVCWFDVGIATGPSTGVTDIHQLIGWAKTRTQEGASVVYGAAPGAGSSSHFAGIAMALASGVPMTPVQYKDSGVGIVDLAAGRLPIMITGTSPLVEMHKSGKIRLLAVSGEQRSPLVPEVPTLKESGLDITIQNSAGLYAPAKMPRDMVERLYGAVMPMLQKADMRDKMIGQGMAPSPMNGSQLAASLAGERKRYAALVKASGYVPEAL
ncbi:Bug family tripartite tricarboxylate transporter substrate binding protein [Variovorax sp. PBL-E5]|uniref:Bug family tripartite tricarboxylate transporter substrate binding protein n=1 Tax=Variovorax sp. PBL-E5 TaxID=434014 RepID=UPI001319B681|nr:tripartite tricarboxylate transporter substrate-binding protein [Variovorax sp. PBL-E5]VTU26003.1 Argininosuccinate lyase [Variovorax sp. PBL-E5]